MSTVADWVAGARPRTWPAALSPVLAGSGIAWHGGFFRIGIGLGCLIVALALQVGVNYANDYSDGIRGTDANRIGPVRLVGSGRASPGAVKSAAFACFGVAGLAGLALVARSGHWWLVAVGVAAILAAWFYTGGRRPYGYLGLGEVFVFCFFGLVAVCGTVYLMGDRLPGAAVWVACAIGFLACAILVANNLRDIVGDRAADKRTLATRLGDTGTRRLYAGLVVAATLCIIGAAAASTWWALLGAAYLPVIAPATRSVLLGARGERLIAVLKMTGVAELVCAASLAVGLAVGRAASF